MASRLVTALGKALFQPSGLILVCAPTSQGKTTSVYHSLLSARAEGAHVVLNTYQLADEEPAWIDVLMAAGVQPLARAELESAPRGSVVMMGDIRDCEAGRTCVDLALQSRLVVAVFRVPSSAAGFTRLFDMGVEPSDVARASLVSFGHRLVSGIHETLALCEELVVSDSIRARIAANESSESIYHQAVIEGMKTLRQAGLEQVAARSASLESVLFFTPE
jgi:general secretion pathway protein E